MDTPRKKPGFVFWATVVLAVPVLYVLSWGPACWIISRTGGEDALGAVYRPIWWALKADIRCCRLRSGITQLPECRKGFGLWIQR